MNFGNSSRNTSSSNVNRLASSGTSTGVASSDPRDLNFQASNTPIQFSTSLGAENLPGLGGMEEHVVMESYSAGFSAPVPSSATINTTNDNDVAFACSICLDGVKDKDPVVTQCGHLYCWPCLYRWLQTRHGEGTCPVCKASVSQENVIPIFIRGSTADPRRGVAVGTDFVPSRPQAHRPEPADMQNNNTQNNATFNFGYNAQIGGISFASGYGFFPSLFGLQFQSFAPAPTSVAASDADEEEQRKYLSRILLCLGVTVILCLLFF